MKFRFLAITISIALVGAVFIARSGPSVAPDFEKMLSFDGKPEIIVDIPAGSSGSAIARLLFDNGIIKSSESYFRVAVGDKRSETVAPGNHRLTLQISARQALEQLLDADRIPNLIRIYEGGWKSEVIITLIAYGFTKAEIDQAFKTVVLPN